VRADVLAAEHGAAKIDRQDAIPALDRHLDNASLAFDAGVVHQHVDAPEVPQRLPAGSGGSDQCNRPKSFMFSISPKLLFRGKAAHFDCEMTL
jgi:hypothetical protein